MRYEDIEKLSPENIEKFYKKWISLIAKKYSKEEVIKHMKKHFNELEDPDLDLINWNASLSNLSDVLNIVLGGENYYIQCKRLLRHYKKDTKSNTPPPSLGRIGFSTGASEGRKVTLEKMIDDFIGVGATVAELLFVRPEELLNFKPSKKFINKLKTFSWLSIHSPWEYFMPDRDKQIKKVIKKLTDLCNKLPVKGVVFHPCIKISENSRIKINFDILEKTELPILIENMNDFKKFGSWPHELKFIKDNYSFGFVFDTNHAYRIDSTMKIGRKILKIYGKRLKEIHVSGFHNDKHYPLYFTKEKAIVEILKQKIGIPKISEGWYGLNFTMERLKAELSYMRSFEI